MAPPTPVPQQNPTDAPSENHSSLQSHALVALLTAVLAGAAWLLFGRQEPPSIEVHPPPTAVVQPTAEPTAQPTAGPIMVHVSGAVVAPGVYELDADSRVVDGLTAAGGFADDADEDAVNLAERILDGAQIYVPAIEEQVSDPPAGVSGGERSVEIQLGGSAMVHLNSATQAELEALPGIGPAKAQAIMGGRPYASVDALLEVSGIGEKTLEQIRDLVDVQ